MTLRNRVMRLAGREEADPLIVFFVTRYENKDGTDDLGSMSAFISGKNINVASRVGETEDEFQDRVSAIAEGCSQ